MRDLSGVFQERFSLLSRNSSAFKFLSLKYAIISTEYEKEKQSLDAEV